MPSIHTHDDPYFDPAIFFLEGGDHAQAADYLSEGDAYRKSTFGLDAFAAAALARHLASRGLSLVDDGPHWLIAAADPDDAPPPTAPLREEPLALCPYCATSATPGRITCGSDACVEALGRDELAARRGSR